MIILFNRIIGISSPPSLFYPRTIGSFDCRCPTTVDRKDHNYQMRFDESNI